jgi:hypothetical protein
MSSQRRLVFLAWCRSSPVRFSAGRKTNRPHVIPKGWTNLGFTGQFRELPDDVVFTIEYSIRDGCGQRAAGSKTEAAARLPRAVGSTCLIPSIRGATQHRSLTAKPGNTCALYPGPSLTVEEWAAATPLRPSGSSTTTIRGPRGCCHRRRRAIAR